MPPATPATSRASDAPDYGVLRDSMGYLIHLAELANMQGFARAFAGTGVTPARLTALELIARNPGIKPVALATAMAVERSNLVGLLRTLQAQGWVLLEAGANRREKALRITPAGRRAVAGLRRRLSRQDATLAERLDPKERMQLAMLLGKIVVRP